MIRYFLIIICYLILISLIVIQLTTPYWFKIVYPDEYLKMIKIKL
jgi:hypothetical protein